eukprot:4233330-Prorocentrum_lima.AAC.1
MFIDYDCHLNERDLFKEVTLALAKVCKAANPNSSMISSDSEQHRELRVLSLGGLNAILESLKEAAASVGGEAEA